MTTLEIDLTTFKRRALAPVKHFHRFGEVTFCSDGERYIYQDNGANVLAVAHLDTVQHMRHFYPVIIDNEPLVFNAQVDDRLGAYVILDLLPKFLGKKYDILLTTGEESGRSSAQHFDTGKQYHWMFSFDRTGADVVMYQYDTQERRTLLKQYGFTPAHGSFSDISSLDHLRCAGFNFGVGYHDYHSKMAYAKLNETLMQAKRFIRFFRDQYQVAMPDEGRRYSRTYSTMYDRDYDSYRDTVPFTNFTSRPASTDLDQAGTLDDFVTRYSGWRYCRGCGYDWPGEMMEDQYCSHCAAAGLKGNDDDQPTEPICL